MSILTVTINIAVGRRAVRKGLCALMVLGGAALNFNVSLTAHNEYAITKPHFLFAAFLAALHTNAATGISFGLTHYLQKQFLY